MKQWQASFTEMRAKLSSVGSMWQNTSPYWGAPEFADSAGKTQLLRPRGHLLVHMPQQHQVRLRGHGDPRMTSVALMTPR